MLGKLIKYDLKYGVKIFGILHGILLTASILGRFLFVNKIDFYADPEIIFSSLSLFIALYVLLFTSINLGVTAMLSVRFTGIFLQMKDIYHGPCLPHLCSSFGQKLYQVLSGMSLIS